MNICSLPPYLLSNLSRQQIRNDLVSSDVRYSGSNVGQSISSLLVAWSGFGLLGIELRFGLQFHVSVVVVFFSTFVLAVVAKRFVVSPLTLHQSKLLTFDVALGQS